MCGGGKGVNGKLASKVDPNANLTQAEKDQIAVEQQAATEANLAMAASRRRRRAGSLLGTARGLLGSPSGTGTPSGGGFSLGGGGTALAGGGRTYGGGKYDDISRENAY